jgi:(2Fe-2S) ferredoxin
MATGGAGRKVRLFVCVKTRKDGEACCAGRGSRELLDAIRAELARRGDDTRIDVRPVKCLDQCEHGPAMVAYRDAAAEETELPEGWRKLFVWPAARFREVATQEVVGICDRLVEIAGK